MSDKTTKFMAKGAFVIDARLFGGNSDSPVTVSEPFKELTLAGLVSAANRDFDFGVATPVSQIIETIQLAQKGDAAVGEWHSLPVPSTPTK